MNFSANNNYEEEYHKFSDKLETDFLINANDCYGIVQHSHSIKQEVATSQEDEFIKEGVATSQEVEVMLSRQKLKCKSEVNASAFFLCVISLFVVAISLSLAALVQIMKFKSDINVAISQVSALKNQEDTCPSVNLDDIHTSLELLETVIDNKMVALQTNDNARENELDARVNNLTTNSFRLKKLQTGVINSLAEVENNSTGKMHEIAARVINLLDTVQDVVNDNISRVYCSSNKIASELEKKVIKDIQNAYKFESCEAISLLSPPLSPGQYWIKTFQGFVQMYCALSCNNITGGWRRVAYLNTTYENATQCPSDLEKVIVSGQNTSRVACRNGFSGGGCSSTSYSTGGTNYTHVCGRVNAYQKGSADAFRDLGSDNFEGNYVDGVSLTYGSSPGRKHIWSFAARASRFPNCSDDCYTRVPEFVRPNYSCSSTLYCGSSGGCLVWDGKQCVGGEYFDRNLKESTTDDIEMRLCRSHGRGDEEFFISLIELYVR